ncbi:MAG: DUF2235 domain-containing protein, partial [Pseudomonadota bacterium]
KGVGTGGVAPLWGAITGAGIDEDVLEAYAFLSEVYSPESCAKKCDEIYVFGFSRGAYAARIFAGFLEAANLPVRAPGIDNEEQAIILKRVFKAFKSQTGASARRAAVDRVPGFSRLPEQVSIKLLGLWDTVAALGWPNAKEDTDELEDRYLDQLCNVEHAAHALSIDDNRATLFTPVLLTADRLLQDCVSSPKMRSEDVEEVWFSGSHSDVGGGYSNTELWGVSLNWMIRQLEPHGLLHDGTRVYANPLGRSNTTDTSVLGYLIYRNLNRRLSVYYTEAGNSYNGGKAKIHRSVFDRLERCEKLPRRFDWRWKYTDESSADQIPDFSSCVRCLGTPEECARCDHGDVQCETHGYRLAPVDNQQCFTIEEYSGGADVRSADWDERPDCQKYQPM